MLRSMRSYDVKNSEELNENHEILHQGGFFCHASVFGKRGIDMKTEKKAEKKAEKEAKNSPVCELKHVFEPLPSFLIPRHP